MFGWFLLLCRPGGVAPPTPSTTAVTRYTVNSGPGQSAAQAVPSHSLGGYSSTTAWGGGVLHDLFNRAAATDVADARSDYRCVYLENPDPEYTWPAVRVYLAVQTIGAAGLYAGVDPRPVSDPDADSPQAVTVDTTYTAPSGVTFEQPADYATSTAEVGDLPPGTGRAVWLRRTPLGAAGAPADAADVIFEGSDSRALVRRVYWETEPYADSTKPSTPATYTATPSPFRRVQVDFLVEGGSRVTWTIDPAFTDARPHVFQLQANVDTAGGWVDVGPPSQDALYLLDPTKRLWGVAPTLMYRVVLTTPAGTYTSPPGSVFGLLSLREWLLAREIVRKEQLNLRALVGAQGYLLKARRYGTRCSCVDPISGEIGNSSDILCYGTGLIDGYYTPVPWTFAVVDNEAAEERVAYSDGTGTTQVEKVTGRMIATLPIVARDAFVIEGSDQRYYCQKVTEIVSLRTTPLVYEVTWRIAPRSDILYQVPVSRPGPELADWQVPTVINL